MSPQANPIAIHYKDSVISMGGLVSTVQEIVSATYVQSKTPWIVTYSGGKDSSIILDLVLKSALKNPSGPRICVVSNNTLVESPLVINHLEKMHKVIKDFVQKHKLNVSVHLTQPPLNNSFWVNLIGKGYPAPNQMFRWCTTRLKIDPTSAFIEENFGNSEMMMVMGTREAESASRMAVIKKYAHSDFFSKHNTRQGCTMFLPIRFMTDDHVWEYLSTNTPPWGGDYRDIINLYREAYGGECPVVTDTSQLKQPSCGERSPRFGCWTCTLVKDDSSLRGLIDSGHTDLAPLYEFRTWLVETRNGIKKPFDNRLPYDRNGRLRYNKGKLAFGAYKISYRKEILKRLRNIQKQTGMKLISTVEIKIIKEIWEDDKRMNDFYKGCKVIVNQMNPKKTITC